VIMRYGIPLLGDRVAPRCTSADEVVVLAQNRKEVHWKKKFPLSDHSMMDLMDLLTKHRVDTLVCGGVSRQNRDFIESRSLAIIDNVACTLDELVSAIRTGSLRPGFGFDEPVLRSAKRQSEPDHSSVPDDSMDAAGDRFDAAPRDCLACTDRACLRGERCLLTAGTTSIALQTECRVERILDAAMDVAFENDRTLCRLSELVYFCLEMRYERLGVAYCIELEEPAEILVRVLRRFFEVRPVCCKIGGQILSDPIGSRNRNPEVACNPIGQAEALNRMDTDLNIIVGMCIGADCVFTKASEAPVTTLFVKDKSLANNPVGAVYSEFYIKEATRTLTVGH
jgi:uncharacterized metal-binding protein